MITKGLFSTDYRSPSFEGYHNPSQRWDRWATPIFDVDQVNRIITWVMNSPDLGEALTWDGPTLVHCLGEAESGRTVRINPNMRGRYRIGSRVWPWLDFPAASTVADHEQAADAHRSARTMTGPVGWKTLSKHGNQPVLPQFSALQSGSPDGVDSGDYVHRLGARTLIMRSTNRDGACAGFDVFSTDGQRLTHADPFPARPTPAQLDSFVTMRRRGLDLLMAEHGLHPDTPHERDLYTLLHGTQPVPRYAALTRTGRTAFIDLHDDLDTAVQSLRERVAQDRACTSLGVQDLDGPFLPAAAQVTITLKVPGRPRTPGPRFENDCLQPSEAAHHTQMIGAGLPANGDGIAARKAFLAQNFGAWADQVERRLNRLILALPRHLAGSQPTPPAPARSRTLTGRAQALVLAWVSALVARAGVLIDQLVSVAVIGLVVSTVRVACAGDRHRAGWGFARCVTLGRKLAPALATSDVTSASTSTPTATAADPRGEAGTAAGEQEHFWAPVT